MRNAAASAAQAAGMGRVHDGGIERAVAAYEAALKASRVAAAERVGWMRPGEDRTPVDTGVRSTELLHMLHL
ncbi:hypothetical protein [Streptomyces sp. NPDC017940]|uniref:hypothetical protein n=1 Tax=Streptomyces sp. NPDC017940 TaxID=3365017 RepID=UPI0037AD5429